MGTNDGGEETNEVDVSAEDLNEDSELLIEKQSGQLNVALQKDEEEEDTTPQTLEIDEKTSMIQDDAEDLMDVAEDSKASGDDKSLDDSGMVSGF